MAQYSESQPQMWLWELYKEEYWYYTKKKNI